MRRQLTLITLSIAACTPAASRNVADTLPQLRTELNPFRYPLELYERRIEGEVTLRLHVDSVGGVVAESISVAKSSGIPTLDSAAVDGAPALLFRPAVLDGRPVPLTVLFPVKFQVPAGGRAPADTHGTVPGR
ncbi:MAG TPA: energy transducer TonB [Gemmatimonadaceae bacterium]